MRTVCFGPHCFWPAMNPSARDAPARSIEGALSRGHAVVYNLEQLMPDLAPSTESPGHGALSYSSDKDSGYRALLARSKVCWDYDRDNGRFWRERQNLHFVFIGYAPTMQPCSNYSFSPVGFFYSSPPSPGSVLFFLFFVFSKSLFHDQDRSEPPPGFRGLWRQRLRCQRPRGGMKVCKGREGVKTAMLQDSNGMEVACYTAASVPSLRHPNHQNRRNLVVVVVGSKDVFRTGLCRGTKFSGSQCKKRVFTRSFVWETSDFA